MKAGPGRKIAKTHYDRKRYRRDRGRMLLVNREWKEEHTEWQNHYYRKSRNEVIESLGGKCVCCNEKECAFLAIDHVNGIKGKRESWRELHRLIVKNKSSKFQLLCHNCNWAKYHGGCPHEKSRARTTA